MNTIKQAEKKLEKSTSEEQVNHLKLSSAAEIWKSLSKIVETILKMDMRGTPTNEPKNKEIDDYIQGITFKMT